MFWFNITDIPKLVHTVALMDMNSIGASTVTPQYTVYYASDYEKHQSITDLSLFIS